MVLFDTVFLLALLDPTAPIPPDPKTGKPIERGRQRVEYLLDSLSDQKVRILVPTPVLAEALVRAGPAIGELVAKIRSVTTIEESPFDTLAAIECAQLTDAALKKGRKRGGAHEEPWQKVKIDRQVVAIAKVRQVSKLYTCDDGLTRLARAEGLAVEHIADLPMPPMRDQPDLWSDSASR